MDKLLKICFIIFGFLPILPTYLKGLPVILLFLIAIYYGIKSNFEDFGVTILRKKNKKKNGVLSGIVNLFVVNNSKRSEDNFVRARREVVVRDKTKSVFNFIWLNVKESIMKIEK